MRRYLALCAVSFAVVLAAIGVCNWFVDPYGYFGSPRIAGINGFPLGFNHRLRLAKALAVTRIRPATVILGNSRPEGAFEVGRFPDQPAYNLALAGAGLGEVRRYLLEAAAGGRLRHAVLSLDLTMFDPALQIQEDSADSVLLTDAYGVISDRSREWRRLAFILFSGTAASDSFWSVNHQGKPVSHYLPSGRREEGADLEQVVREGGHRAAARRVEAAFLASTLRDVGSPAFRRSYAAALDELRSIATRASMRGFRLTFVLNPIHARHTYLYAAAGLWPFYEEWKRDLMEIVRTDPQRISLWDFSGVSPCTAEPMPPIADSAISMRWYRESAHFRVALGDQVIERVLGLPSDGACPGLGEPLTADTIEAALASQKRALAHWTATHPEDVSEIDEAAEARGRAGRPQR